MPSRRRITITCDEELEAALARARGLCPDMSEEALLRTMALRGIAAAEEARRRELVERLIEWVTAPDWPPMGADELERSAWGIEHKLPAERRARSADPGD